MKKQLKFWDNCAEKYDSQALKTYSETYKDTINKAFAYLNAADTVLELACGTGITTIEIAKRVKKVYAVDLSQRMIDKAKTKAEEQAVDNIEFSISAIEEINYPSESFDAVTAFNVLYFLRDGEKALGQIHKMLKPGGVFLSATDCLGEKKNIKSVLLSLFGKIGLIPYVGLYKMDGLYNMIKRNGFDIIEAENLYGTPPNYFIAAKKQ